MLRALTHQRTKTTKRGTEADPELAPLHDATPEELMETLDWRACRFLGISADEFLSRWFGGYYDADPDQSGVIVCAMMAPFVEEHWRKHRRS